MSLCTKADKNWACSQVSLWCAVGNQSSENGCVVQFLGKISVQPQSLIIMNAAISYFFTQIVYMNWVDTCVHSKSIGLSGNLTKSYYRCYYHFLICSFLCLTSLFPCKARSVSNLTNELFTFNFNFIASINYNILIQQYIEQWYM